MVATIGHSLILAKTIRITPGPLRPVSCVVWPRFCPQTAVDLALSQAEPDPGPQPDATLGGASRIAAIPEPFSHEAQRLAGGTMPFMRRYTTSCP